MGTNPDHIIIQNSVKLGHFVGVHKECTRAHKVPIWEECLTLFLSASNCRVQQGLVIMMQV